MPNGNGNGNGAMPLQEFRMRYPHLYLYDPTYSLPPNIEAEFYVYQFPVFAAIGLAATPQQQIIIQANTSFEMREIVYYENIANAAFTSGARPIPNVNIMLTDSGSGKNLFSAPVPLASIASDVVSRRRALIWPRIFAPNSTITATLTNFDAALATANIFLTLIGRHLYRLAG